MHRERVGNVEDDGEASGNDGHRCHPRLRVDIEACSRRWLSRISSEDMFWHAFEVPRVLSCFSLFLSFCTCIGFVSNTPTLVSFRIGSCRHVHGSHPRVARPLSCPSVTWVLLSRPRRGGWHAHVIPPTLCSRGGSIFSPRIARGKIPVDVGFPFLRSEETGRRSGSNPKGFPFRKGTLDPRRATLVYQSTCARDDVCARARRTPCDHSASSWNSACRNGEEEDEERTDVERKPRGRGTKQSEPVEGPTDGEGWTKHEGVVADEACHDGSHVRETDGKQRRWTMQSHAPTVNVAWDVESPGGKTQTRVPCGKTESSVGSLDCMAQWR